jgi:hypothetical protein
VVQALRDGEPIEDLKMEKVTAQPGKSTDSPPRTARIA